MCTLVRLNNKFYQFNFNKINSDHGTIILLMLYDDITVKTVTNYNFYTKKYPL